MCKILKKYNNMRSFRIVLSLLVVLFSTVVSAQELTARLEMLEIGAQVGGGFAWNKGLPLNGISRSASFGWFPDKEVPAMETYGGMLRCNLDERWTVQVQAMTQRLMFNEQLAKTYPSENPPVYSYYNTMCNLDAMTEINILKYGFSRDRLRNVYTIVPYVAVGLGMSIYNQNATFAFQNKGDGQSKFNTSYPAIGKDRSVAMYVPFGLGMKMRLTGNLQIKFSCQYDLYVAGKDGFVDFYGATYTDKNDIVVRKNNSGLSDKELINSLSQVDDMRKPRYDDLKKAYTKAYKNGEASIVDNNHNLVFAVGLIFNFTKTYRDMIIEY